MFLLNLVEYLRVIVVNHLRLLILTFWVEAKSVFTDYAMSLLLFAVVLFASVVAERTLVAIKASVVPGFKLNVGHVRVGVLQPQISLLDC